MRMVLGYSVKGDSKVEKILSDFWAESSRREWVLSGAERRER